MAIFVRDKHKRILVCWARRNIRQTLERSRKESRGWVLYFSFVFVFCICISLGLVSPDKGMGVLGWHTPTHQPFSKRRPTCVSNNARQCLGLKNQDFLVWGASCTMYSLQPFSLQYRWIQSSAMPLNVIFRRMSLLQHVFKSQAGFLLCVIDPLSEQKARQENINKQTQTKGTNSNKIHCSLDPMCWKMRKRRTQGAVSIL